MSHLGETPEFARAMRLEDKLFELTGASRSEHDLLREYHLWLEKSKINPQTNGWPSEQAYDEANITAFVRDWQSVFCDGLEPLSVEDYPDYITCPACNGTGMHDDNHGCCTCMGNGSITEEQQAQMKAEVRRG